MAASRPKRANAGSKMASLLNEEEKEMLKADDGFYATKYGGFVEEQEDRDFAYQSPNEEDDEVRRCTCLIFRRKKKIEPL